MDQLVRMCTGSQDVWRFSANDGCMYNANIETKTGTRSIY